MSCRTLLHYLLLLCVLYAIPVQASSFTARVDRSELSAGESVELILESDDTTHFLAPDLTPLKPLFELLSSQQINRFNESGQPVTQWILTLLPKQTGLLIIPPLSLGELNSAPIHLYIKDFNQPDIFPLEPVYIDSQLDREWVYLQAQLILTLRIYHAIPLFADSNLTPLSLDNARVEQLGKPRTFEQHINGVRHGVIEVSYAIYPQQTGTINIAPQTFSATLAGHDPHSLTPFSARPGQRIQVQSAQIPVQVKDIPSEYPADAAWLPAQQVTLQQTWTPSLNSTIHTGTAVTRLLQLDVKGLAGSQLPALPANTSRAYQVYLDKPTFSHQYTANGVLSSRHERQAFVFHQSGQQTLDAIKLPWWNTTTDQLEYAVLAEQNLQVNAASAPVSEMHHELGTPVLSSEPAKNTANPAQLRLWQAASFLFMLLSLVGFSLWWRARQQPAVLSNPNLTVSARNLHDSLKRACLSNDPHSARQALDAWVRQHSLSLLEMTATHSELKTAVEALNNALYAEVSSPWQGAALWQAIEQYTLDKQNKTTQTEQLPPLYPP